MIASLLGQGTVVDRLLEEEGEDINARSEIHGTALNIAAVQEDEDVTRRLLQRNVKAHLGGKEYTILHTKKSELEFGLRRELREVGFEFLIRRERVSEQDQPRLRDEAITDPWPAECCSGFLSFALLGFSDVFASRTHQIRTPCPAGARPPRDQALV